MALRRTNILLYIASYWTITYSSIFQYSGFFVGFLEFYEVKNSIQQQATMTVNHKESVFKIGFNTHHNHIFEPWALTES